jgi:hypothetical protein
VVLAAWAIAGCSSSVEVSGNDGAGGAGGSGGLGGSTSAAEGSGGTATSGSGGDGTSTSTGSGGDAASASSSVSTTSNSSGSGGSGGDAASGGSGGDAASGGSGGDAASGGSGGDAASGGSGGDASTGGSAGTGGGASDCGGGETCAPAVPEGFEGPVVVGTGSCSASGGYSSKLLDLHSGLLPGSAVCDCRCGEPNTSCSVSLVAWNNSNCDDEALGGTTADINECDPMSYHTGEYVGVSTSPSGNCVANDSGNSLPTPGWTSDLRLCGGAQAGASCSDDGQCVPDPTSSFGSVCVHAEGDVECPTAYPDKQVYYQGFSDNRACGACTCGSLSGAACSTQADFFSATNCSGTPNLSNVVITSSEDPFCNLGGTYNRVRVDSVSVTNAGQCQPADTSLTGSVNATGATTLCCR